MGQLYEYREQAVAATEEFVRREAEAIMRRASRERDDSGRSIQQSHNHQAT